MLIFGGKDAWPLERFRAVNDTVRGGNSSSYLALFKEEGSSTRGNRIRFSGQLDIKTLGNAGFASQICDTFPPLPAKQYSGLRFTLYPFSVTSLKTPTDFVFTLKTQAPEKRPDGRLESRVSYEFRFKKPLAKVLTLQAHWNDFEPTYRGKPMSGDDAPALDPAELKEFGIMCRSFFEGAHGPFDLIIGQVEAIPVAPHSWMEWMIGWIQYYFPGLL